MEIKNSYLMWVGSINYKTINDYVAEAKLLGVSKRLPDATIGRALTEPGTVVFVAHDEGETTECVKCLGDIECGDCRARLETIKKWEAQADDVKKRFAEETPGTKLRILRTREQRIAKLRAEIKACSLCAGELTYRGGTGGRVVFEDGKVWDYRRFNYWLHQPKKFDPETAGISERIMCSHCGGNGVRPKGVVFGMFLPEQIEYVLKGDEEKKFLDEISSFHKVPFESIHREAPRGCGKRKPGGVYAVTAAKPSKAVAKRTKAALDELVARGVVKPSEARVHGSFVEFMVSVPIDSKRFRGIAKFDVPKGKIAAQAEMIAEAVA